MSFNANLDLNFDISNKNEAFVHEYTKPESHTQNSQNNQNSQNTQNNQNNQKAQNNKNYEKFVDHDTNHEPYSYDPSNKAAPETLKRNHAIQKFAKVSERAKIVYIFLIIGIVLSLVIAGLGFVISAKVSSGIAYVLIGFGFFSAAVFGYGIYAVRSYTKRVDIFLVDPEHNDPELIDQSKERTFLNIFLYLTMIIFLVFLILSIGCFAFQDDARNEIRGISTNQAKWNRYFGDASYDSVMNNLVKAMYAVATISLILCGFIATLLFFTFSVLGTYRSWQTVIEFVCVLFFMLGFAFLYLAVYAEKYKDVANVDKAMPQWVPDALLGVAIASIALAIFGFVAAHQESKNLLKTFSLVTAVFTACVLVLSIGGALYAGQFQEYFSKRCYAILDHVNQDYLIKYAQCDQKYLFLSNSIDNMRCPKERVVSAWEVNLGVESDKQKDIYGCLDAGCCVATYGYIKTKMDYLALVAFTLFIFGCLMVGGACYMLGQLNENREFAPKDTKASYALYAIAGITVILMVIFIAMIPSPPTPSPLSSAQVDSSPKNATNIAANTVLQVNATQFTANETAELNAEAKVNTSIAENKTACGAGCVSLSYYYELSSLDGTFVPNQNLLNSARVGIVINQANGTGWTVGFNGTSDNLQNFTNYFTFVHNCPLYPSFIKVRVVATAVPKKTAFAELTSSPSFSFIQMKARNKMRQAPRNANNTRTNRNTTINPDIHAAIIDVSKLKEGDVVSVLDTTLDYSFVDSLQYQTISGVIQQVVDLNTNAPVAGATVKLTPMDFAQCPITIYTTNTNGAFTSNKLYPIKGEVPTTYRVEVIAPGLTPYKTKVKVGGIGAGNDINIGTVGMWSAAMLQKSEVKSTIINSINNQPLSGVTVSLYSGYADFENAATTPTGTSFIQLQQSPNTTNNTTSIYSNTTSNSTTTNNTVVTQAQTNASGSVPVPKPVYVSNTTSNDNGTFAFKDLTPGTYTIVFEKDGFYREVHRKFQY